MTTVTLEAVKTEQERLNQMIAQLEAQAAVRRITLPGFEIVLHPGEQYAGMIIGKDGEPNYHLILLPGEAESIEWEAAKEWAAQQGGRLPTRREQALLYANLKDQFESSWYWSGEQHSDESYAWYQYFSNGGQHYTSISNELRARAVRSINY